MGLWARESPGLNKDAPTIPRNIAMRARTPLLECEGTVHFPLLELPSNSSSISRDFRTIAAAPRFASKSYPENRIIIAGSLDTRILNAAAETLSGMYWDQRAPVTFFSVKAG